jgi:site-specific DNA recombinase
MKIAAYLRVSTDEQAEQGISIPAQQSRLMAYCQSQGWEIFDFYIDDGYSGKDLERPAMQRLLRDAGAKKFNAVLVLKLDRLSRRQKDVLYILEDIFEPNGIGFKSATEAFDTTTPFGKAAIGMMAVFAQLERETIVERVRMAKKESARQGRFMGGIAPYGYRYNSVHKLLEIDELQAVIVRRIYDFYLEHSHGYQYIGEELARQGVPGPTGKGWRKQEIRKILTNPVYTGLVSHQGVLYQGQQPPIIEAAKWREVQALIRDRGAVRASASVHAGLLSGLIWCGECSARMRAKNTWQNHPCTNPKKVIRYYVCYSQDGSAKQMVTKAGCRCGYKRAEEIENKVIDALYHYSYDQELVRYVVDEANNINLDNNSLLAGINQAKKDLAAIDKKLNRWYGAFERDAVEPEELRERVKYLRDRKAYLQRQLAAMEKELQAGNTRQINTKDRFELLANFPVIWEEADATERRGIITNMIEKVKVFSDNRVEIDFNA